VERARGRVVKTTGDGALALFDGPARAVRCARSVLSGIKRLGIEARAGVHTGEVEPARQGTWAASRSTLGPEWLLLLVAARSWYRGPSWTWWRGRDSSSPIMESKS